MEQTKGGGRGAGVGRGNLSRGMQIPGRLQKFWQPKTSPTNQIKWARAVHLSRAVATGQSTG